MEPTRECRRRIEATTSKVLETLIKDRCDAKPVQLRSLSICP